MKKLFRKLRAMLYRSDFEAWKKQCYASTDGVREEITKPFLEWVEKEAEQIFMEGGPNAVEEARLEWFRVVSYLPFVVMAANGIKNDKVAQVFKEDLVFLASIFVYRDGKIIHGFHIGNGEVAIKNSSIVLAKDEPVYVKTG